MAIYCKAPGNEAAIWAAPDCPARAQSVGRWVLAATIAGSSMALIDATVVNVALPALQSDLDASVAELQWIVESYALFLAALILAGGMMGDLYGRRRIFALGVAAFGVASALCGLAPGAFELVVARAVQGAGAALMVPGSLALISANFSEAQRGRAIGTWSGATALAMALGPVLGGWLVDNVSWRWIFYINLTPAAVVLVILYRFVPESRNRSAGGRLDGWGALLATLGLGALVFGLIESGLSGFDDALVLGAMGLGAAALGVFVVVESRATAPMMPLDMFRSPAFSGANLITLLLYAGLSGGLFFVPFNLIQVQGYSATAAGAAFLPFILVMSLLSRWAGGLVDRFGGRPPLVLGPLVAAMGFALFAVPGTSGSYWTTVLPAMLVLGLGMAISVAPLTTVVMGAAATDRAGIASGINNAVARTAGLLAIAVMGIFVLLAFNHSLDAHLAALELPPAARQALDAERIKLAGASLPAGLGDELSAALERALADSFLSGYRLVMLMAAGLALASAASAALTLKPAPAPAGPGA